MVDVATERMDSAKAKQVNNREVDAQPLLDFAAHLHHEQRMPSQFKEVVMDPTTGKMQHLLPDRCDAALQVRPGGVPGGASLSAGEGIRQGVAIQFAAARQG